MNLVLKPSVSLFVKRGSAFSGGRGKPSFY
jgi:hypothetical protein